MTTPSAVPETEHSADVIGGTALYRAFLEHAAAVRKWYPHDPWRRPLEAAKAYPAERRAEVARILEGQNRHGEAGDRTLENIERFKSGASVVVTGQQVGLFGGPLYSLLKALTAIKLASEQTRAGIDTVPIFWLATEDHDIEEVRFAKVLSRDHQLLKLQLLVKDEGKRAGEVELGTAVRALITQMREHLGESELLALVERCYGPGKDFGDAFAELFAHLFSEYGLILIDNRDPRLHAIAAPIFMKAAAHAKPLNSALRQRDQELAAAGFHAQVHIEESSTLLFHHQAEKRMAVKIANGRFKAGQREWNAEELAKEAERAPQDFSANALLRPVVQDYLLPTTAYVGGAAEIAYFAQSEVLYRELLGRVTPVLPRASMTLVEPAVSRLLEKFGLTASDVLVPAKELHERIAEQRLPAAVRRKAQEVSQSAEAELDSLAAAAEAVDPTLRGAADNAARKVRYQIKRLRERTARAYLRRQGELDRQLRRISDSLYPHDSLQERELSGIYFLCRHGKTVLERVYEAIDTTDPRHRFVSL